MQQQMMNVSPERRTAGRRGLLRDPADGDAGCIGGNRFCNRSDRCSLASPGGSSAPFGWPWRRGFSTTYARGATTPRLGFFDSGVGIDVWRVLERHGSVSCLLRYGWFPTATVRQRRFAVLLLRWSDGCVISSVDGGHGLQYHQRLGRDVAEGQAGGPVIGLIGAAAAMVETRRWGAGDTSHGPRGLQRQHRSTHPGALVVEQACPAFVPLLSWDCSSDELRQMARSISIPSGGVCGDDCSRLHAHPLLILC